MTTLQQRLRRPASERGFTLIELLVVIIILGVLAAVVVFAVRGVGDKGKSSATTIDARTIRTAQEAYCAKNGRYADGATLKAEGFLSDLPQYHEVFASQTGGNCNGWRYAVLRTDQADPYPLGSWALTAGQPFSPPSYDPDPDNSNEFMGDVVRLADGRVLAISKLDVPGAEIWDPATGAWTDVAPYEQDRASFDALALVLRDDPNTPQSECAGAVDNCNKVLFDAFGCGFCDPVYFLFDPDNPGAAWEGVPKAPGSYTSNTFVRLGMVQLMDDPTRSGSQCGPNCGKVFIYGVGGPGTASADLYDPRDNSFTPVAFDDPAITPELGVFAPLPDGRYLMVGEPSGVPRAKIFDPATLTFSDATAPSNRHGGDAFRRWALLPSGEILVGGPNTKANGDRSGDAEIYTPAPAPGGGSWRTVPGCNGADFVNLTCHLVESLPDGRVLAYARNDNVGNSPVTMFLFNPATEKWASAANLNDIFSAAEGIYLDPAGGGCDPHCGKVLMVGGGNNNDGTAHSSSELFTP